MKIDISLEADFPNLGKIVDEAVRVSQDLADVLAKEVVRVKKSVERKPQEAPASPGPG
jgi:hypothetical protein